MTLIDLINEEMGEMLQERPQTISSPFRRDSSPSFRLYSVDTEGNCRGAFDWGTGKSYNIFSFLMELRGLSFKEAVEYLSSRYPNQFSEEVVHRINSVSARYDLVNYLPDPTSIADITNIEKALTSASKGDYTLFRDLVERKVIANLP